MGQLFYIPIYPTGENSKQNTFGNLFGPFQDRNEMHEDMRTNFRSFPHTAFLIINGCVAIQEPNPKALAESKKRSPGNSKNYVTENGVTSCRTCGEKTSVVHVPFPVDLSDWRKGRPGCNDCGYEAVHYCPNCERRPTYKDLPQCKCKQNT